MADGAAWGQSTGLARMKDKVRARVQNRPPCAQLTYPPFPDPPAGAGAEAGVPPGTRGPRSLERTVQRGGLSALPGIYKRSYHTPPACRYSATSWLTCGFRRLSLLSGRKCNSLLYCLFEVKTKWRLWYRYMWVNESFPMPPRHVCIVVPVGWLVIGPVKNAHIA